MQVRSRKAFQGKLGYIEAGTTFTCSDHYADHLIRHGMAVEFKPSNLDAMLTPEGGPERREPDNNRNLGDAPRRKDGGEGNGEGGPGGPSAPSAPDSPQAAGKTVTSSSVRRDRRSMNKTSIGSEAKLP
jgi:hypothetical protein